MKTKSAKYLAVPYLVWMTGFIVIPLLLILYYGITDKSGAFTLANIAAIVRREHFKPLYLALGLSAVSTAICLLLAFPLALILRRRGVGKGSFVAFIFILPMWMNFLLRTLAWQTLLERKGVLNAFLELAGLPPQGLINTSGAVVLGMVYNFLPFMILPIYNTMVKIDDNTINAARDLGANTLQTIARVILPLSVPGIMSGVTMVFVPSMTTFVISNILGGGKVYLIGNVIEQEFTRASNWHLGSGISLVLMVFILISMLLLAKTDDGEGQMF